MTTTPSVPLGATVLTWHDGRIVTGTVVAVIERRPFPWLRRVPFAYVRLWDRERKVYIDGERSRLPDGRTIAVRCADLDVLGVPDIGTGDVHELGLIGDLPDDPA